LVYDRGSDLGLKGFRHKTTGREVGIFECDFTTRYKIASELGRDQNLGETYEEIAGKIGRHSMRKNFPQDQIQISDSHSESILDNKQKNDVSLSPKPKSQQNFEKENDGYLNDNELLKLIISAESLVKQNKHDDYILSIFVKEKERNTSSYKFLNKNGRIYNLIQEMEKNRQQQKKTIAKDKSIIKSNFSMIIFFIFLLAVGGFALKLIIKKRKSNKVFYY
jgi:hypothetical protein